MKLRAYDRYHKRPIIIDFAYFDDEVHLDSWSSHNATGKVFIRISTDQDSWKKYGLEYDEDNKPKTYDSYINDLKLVFKQNGWSEVIND